ncbi:MAG: hypothetical protein NC078_05365 [Ruminococcus sp.]|nr:hypothetical protein [Ruminococcus sp.]
MKNIIAALLFIPALIILPNVGVMTVNSIMADSARRELVKEAEAQNLSVVDSGCKVGHFFGNGNGAE